MSTPYELLGGEAGVRALANELYQVMSQRPEASTIRSMHAKNTADVAERLFMFLSGWMGGPDLYFQKYGTVCLSSQHAQFATGRDEREQWLGCMDKAVVSFNGTDEHSHRCKEPGVGLVVMIINVDTSVVV